MSSKFLLGCFLILSTACVSTRPPANQKSAWSNYNRNRAMDARDVIGASLVGGIPVIGLKAYLGPLGLGFFYAPEYSVHGVIGAGEIGLKNGEIGSHDLEDNTWVLTWHEAMHANSYRARLRGKDTEQMIDDNPAYYTRVGVSGACLLGLRLEFNPGELLDLLLGFTTLDILVVC